MSLAEIAARLGVAVETLSSLQQSDGTYLVTSDTPISVAIQADIEVTLGPQAAADVDIVQET